ncbi:hypothetical protein [Mycobacterium sp. DL592]|uniref:hypothetical protein n=1 Tax=Mycobacterium sp. DL592 TaxID=2675524 RepID=UPI00142352ED|nr:hypothetical protein [Mycobacterium sp. DL592]
MTHFGSDEERWAAVQEVMKHSPTPEEDVANAAAVDGLEIVRRQVEYYQDAELPSGRRYPGLSKSDAARQAVATVMSEYYWGDLRQIEEHQPKMPGVPLSTFDKHNPSHYGGLFVIFADRPTVAHSMRYDTVEDLITRAGRSQCYWRGHNVLCAEYAPNYLCFARPSQYLLLFPSCFYCTQWLRAGAPDPNTWVRMYNERRAQAAENSAS